MNIKEVRNRYLELRDKFMRYKGVLGVGYGEAEKNGKLTGKPAIIVFVEEKLPKSKIRKGEFINATYQGVNIDVRKPRLTEEQHLDYIERNGLSELDAEENTDIFWLDDGKLHQMYQKRRQRERIKKEGNGTHIEPGEEPAEPPKRLFMARFLSLRMPTAIQ